MKGAVLLDTGPLVAYLDKSDQHHDWAIEQFSSLSSPFFLPEAVLSETSFLLADVPQAVAKVGNWLQRGILILSPIGAAAQTAVFELMQKYRKVPMSYADACMVWLAGAHAGSRVFTVDSDFQIYRLERNRPVSLISPF